MWLSVLLTIVVVVAIFLFCAYIARQFAFRNQTRDGDSWGNRLAGRGPNDEVGYRSARERLADLRSRRRDQSPEDD